MSEAVVPDITNGSNAHATVSHVMSTSVEPASHSMAEGPFVKSVSFFSDSQQATGGAASGGRKSIDGSLSTAADDAVVIPSLPRGSRPSTAGRATERRRSSSSSASNVRGRSPRGSTSTTAPTPPRGSAARPTGRKSSGGGGARPSVMGGPPPVTSVSKAAVLAHNAKLFGKRITQETLKRKLSKIAGWQLTDDDIERFVGTLEDEDREEENEGERRREEARSFLQSQPNPFASETGRTASPGLGQSGSEKERRGSNASQRSVSPAFGAGPPLSPRSPGDNTAARRQSSALFSPRSRRFSSGSNLGFPGNLNDRRRSSNLTVSSTMDLTRRRSSGRVQFGGSRAMSDAQRVQMKARRRYERLLSCAQRENAARRIQRWYRETKTFNQIFYELRMKRKLKKVMNIHVLRWVAKIRQRHRARKEREAAEAALLALHNRSATKIQRVTRSFIQILGRKRLTRSKNEALQERLRLEKREYGALCIQAWWRERLVHSVYWLPIRSLRRIKATKFTFAVRAHLKLKESKLVREEIAQLHNAAAVLIQRTYRAHAKAVNTAQLRFRVEKELYIHPRDDDAV